MYELASRDGVVSVTPDNQYQLALSWQLDSLNPEVVESFKANENSDRYLVVGRSMLAIAGIDVQQAAPPAVESDGRLFIPIDASSYTPLAEKMLSRIGDLQSGLRPGENPIIRWNGQQVGFGNILNIGDLERLDGDRIQRAIDENIIWIDREAPDRPTNYTVTDSSLKVDMASWELDLDHDAIMGDDTNMLNLALHGRRGFSTLTDINEPDPADLHGKFAVRAALIAPGNLTAQVLGTNDPKLTQVPSGAFIHANRFMGTDIRLPKQSRGQQIELINGGAQVTWGDAQAEIAFYQPKREERIRMAVQPSVDLEEMAPEKRAQLQQKGYNIMSLLARRDIYDVISQSIDGVNCALVITPNGITEVARTDYDSRNARHILNAAISSGTVRTVPQHLSELEPFIEKLGLVANNPRIVVADRLLLSDIPDIVNKGDVQAVIIRDYGHKFMNQKDHTAMLELVNRGVTIAWDNQGDLRKLHRSGFWMTSESIERFEQLEFVGTFYGTAEDAIAKHFYDDYDRFFDIMSKLMPVSKMGFVHGNGLAAMQAADELSRLYGMMSLGVSIDVENMGQGGMRTSPNGHFGVLSDMRTYRQTFIDRTRDGAFLTPGGGGTLEEGDISVVTEKLLDNNLFEITVGAPDQLFMPWIKQLNKLAGITQLHPEGGPVIELGEKRLLPPWLPKLVVHKPTLEKAAQSFTGFWNDMPGAWARAGVPEKAVKMASAKRLIVADSIGRIVSPHILEAVESYKGPIAA